MSVRSKIYLPIKNICIRIINFLFGENRMTTFVIKKKGYFVYDFNLIFACYWLGIVSNVIYE